MDRDLDNFQTTPLVSRRLVRITYLVTYCQADLAKFPTRKEFDKYNKKYFNIGGGKVRVQHEACFPQKKPGWRGPLPCCAKID